MRVVWPSKNYWLIVLSILTFTLAASYIVSIHSYNSLSEIVDSQQSIIKQYETLFKDSTNKVGEGYARDTY